MNLLVDDSREPAVIRFHTGSYLYLLAKLIIGVIFFIFFFYHINYSRVTS